MSLDTAVQVLLVGPVLVIWILAVRDAFRRTAGRRRLRMLVVLPLVVFPPLSVLYLLADTPSAVRRGAVRRDDPRSELLDRLEASVDAR